MTYEPCIDSLLKMSQLQPGRSRRSSARLTPYSSRRNRETVAQNILNYGPSPKQTGVITKFLSKTCHIFCVSPLWKFETSKRSLERYSGHLTGLLATPSEKRGEGQYVAKVGCVSSFGLDASHAVEIIVRHKHSLPRAASPVCYGVLCRMDSPPLKTQKGFTYLPLLCVHGLPDVAMVIMDWLRNTFDCHITAKKIEEACLYKLAGNYATTPASGVGRRGGVGKVGLVYHTPSPVKAAGLTSVSLDIPCNSIETLLNSGGSTTPSSGDKTMPTQLQKLLGDLVHTHFHLKLHSLELVRLSLPVLDIQQDASIKFNSPDHVMPILSAIQHYIM